MADRQFLERLTKRLTDEGKLIEAGFVGFRLAALDDQAPKEQIVQLRAAFFAGAHHLLASVLTFLDDGDEPTEADLQRMTLIQRELDEFVDRFKLQHLPASGRA